MTMLCLHFCELYCDNFIQFLFSEVERAVAALNGRFFGGRMLTAEKYDQEMFNSNDLSG